MALANRKLSLSDFHLYQDRGLSIFILTAGALLIMRCSGAGGRGLTLWSSIRSWPSCSHSALALLACYRSPASAFSLTLCAASAGLLQVTEAADSLLFFTIIFTYTPMVWLKVVVLPAGVQSGLAPGGPAEVSAARTAADAVSDADAPQAAAACAAVAQASTQVILAHKPPPGSSGSAGITRIAVGVAFSGAPASAPRNTLHAFFPQAAAPPADRAAQAAGHDKKAAAHSHKEQRSSGLVEFRAQEAAAAADPSVHLLGSDHAPVAAAEAQRGPSRPGVSGAMCGTLPGLQDRAAGCRAGKAGSQGNGVELQGLQSGMAAQADARAAPPPTGKMPGGLHEELAEAAKAVQSQHAAEDPASVVATGAGCSSEDAMLAARLQAEELQQYKMQRSSSSGSRTRPGHQGPGLKGIQKALGRRPVAGGKQGPLDMLFKRRKQ